jgi:hypothetical protein
LVHHNPPSRNNKKAAWNSPNWLPDPPVSEDELSVLSHQATLKNQARQVPLKRDDSIINHAMAAPLHHRQKLLVEERMLIICFKEEYPILFDDEQVSRENDDAL